MRSLPRRDDERPSPKVFIHIFKAAGTSVQLQLRGKYGLEGIPQVNDGPDFALRIKRALEREQTAVIAGHFRYTRISWAYSEAGQPSPKCFSFVRDPVERFVSAFNYFRMTPGEKWHSEALERDINSFAEFLVRADPDSIANHQCRALSEHGEASFQAARDSIEMNFGFVGMVDNLNAVNKMAKIFLQFQFDQRTRHNKSRPFQNINDLSTKAIQTLKSVTDQDDLLIKYIKQNQNGYIGIL